MIRPAGMVLWTFCSMGIAATAARSQELVVSPESMFFSFQSATQSPGAQSVTVSTATKSQVSVNMEVREGKWLRVNKAWGMTPASFEVSVNPAGLGPGTYTGILTATAGDSSRDVTVSLVVPRTQHFLIVAPSFLSFAGESEGKAPMTKIVTVASGVGASTPFTATSLGGQNWLSVRPASAVTPAAIEVIVDYYVLPAGVYRGLVNVVDPDGYVACSIQVTLTITEAGPLEISPTELSFTMDLGSSVRQVEEIYISSTTGEDVSFQATPFTSSGGNWFNVDPLNAATEDLGASLVVVANAEGLGVGTYRGMIRITALWQTIELPVRLEVVNGPFLDATPSSLWFEGDDTNPPPPQEFIVETSDGSEAPFEVTTQDGDWLEVSPMSGTAPAELTVSIKPNRFGAGVYNGKVTVSSPGSSATSTVAVTLEVATLSSVELSPWGVDLTADSSDIEAVSQEVSVTSNIGAPSFVASASPEWLSVTPASGVCPAKLTVTANPAGLAEGEYTGSIVIGARTPADYPVSLPVTLTVTGRPVIGAIVHAATGRAGVFTGGAGVSIYGRHLGPEDPAGLTIGEEGAAMTTLVGVSVLFDETPAPLLYVQESQVSAIVPYSVLDKGSATVVVELGGVRSKEMRIQLFEAAPGIFTADSSGSGLAAALNENGSVNSSGNPAKRGSVISVYATGAGAMSPSPEDGAIAKSPAPVPLLPVKAWIGGKAAEVLYAGGAPGMIAGILQINIRAPEEAPSGTPPLVITIGKMSSQPGVSVAVE